MDNTLKNSDTDIGYAKLIPQTQWHFNKQVVLVPSYKHEKRPHNRKIKHLSNPLPSPQLSCSTGGCLSEDHWLLNDVATIHVSQQLIPTFISPLSIIFYIINNDFRNTQIEETGRERDRETERQREREGREREGSTLNFPSGQL